MRKIFALAVIILLVPRHAAFAQNAPLATGAAAAAELGLRSGPMLGYSELTEVALWVQTTRPAHVQFRYWIEGQPNTSQLSAAVATTREDDHLAHLVLSFLKAGQRYGYELYLDGKLVPLPYRLTFQTQAHWQWRTDPPAFTVALGSCAYVNEKEHDRPGEPYGGDFEIFTALTAKQPDVMLWLGDNIYYREPDFYSTAFMRHRNAHGRALPEWQALLAATHHYAIWDDHDDGPNDSDWTYRLKREALEIFKS
ncbi:alkaline phosphatase family protein, partial [candidate division KSB1 bacterium]|nr:alkaline phosphatase family protein [candidate division KSB1 bacterium]